MARNRYCLIKVLIEDAKIDKEEAITRMSATNELHHLLNLDTNENGFKEMGHKKNKYTIFCLVGCIWSGSSLSIRISLEL